MLSADLVGLECGEPLESKVKDCLRLNTGQLEVVDQSVPGNVRILGSTDQLDDSIKLIECDQQAFEDVGAGFFLTKLKLRAANDYLALVVHVVNKDLLERKRLRNTVNQGDHVDPER